MTDNQPSYAPTPGAIRTPSGLFPAGAPPRPTYREPHPVRGGPVAAGLAGAGVWLLLFGLLGRSLVGYGWWTAVAGLVAWGVAVGLTMAGDRGVGLGIATATAVGWSAAAAALTIRWATTGDWPLW